MSNVGKKEFAKNQFEGVGEKDPICLHAADDLLRSETVPSCVD